MKADTIDNPTFTAREPTRESIPPVLPYAREPVLNRGWGRIVPRGAPWSAIAAILVPIPFAWAMTAFRTPILRDYGWGLFVGGLFVVAMGSTFIFGWHEERDYFASILVSFAALIACTAVVLFARRDDAIFLIIAAPLAMFVAYFGSTIAFFILLIIRPEPRGYLLLALSVGVSAWRVSESHWHSPPAFRAVMSSVEIAASPPIVWAKVVRFPKLDSLEGATKDTST